MMMHHDDNDDDDELVASILFALTNSTSSVARIRSDSEEDAMANAI